MNITNARATIGLNCKVTHTSTATTGSVQIGDSNESVAINLPVSAYCVRAFMANLAGVSINLQTGVLTTATPFIAGTAQMHTATAAGTVTTGGNAVATVTYPGMTGSPKAVNVAVVSADTPTIWAEKVRVALNADTVISALFTAAGSGVSITLTRKPVQSITAGSEVVNHYANNEATMNLALAPGTAVGITAAPTSVNTIVGVRTEGTKMYDSGTDFEGVPLISSNPVSVVYSATGEGLTTVSGTTDFFKVRPGGTVLMAGNGTEAQSISDNQLSMTVAGGSVDLIITVISKNP